MRGRDDFDRRWEQFDRDFDRAERWGRIFAAFVFTLAVTITVTVFAGVAFLAVAAVRLGPEGIATMGGQLLATFEESHDAARRRP